MANHPHQISIKQQVTQEDTSPKQSLLEPATEGSDAAKADRRDSFVTDPSRRQSPSAQEDHLPWRQPRDLEGMGACLNANRFAFAKPPKYLPKHLESWRRSYDNDNSRNAQLAPTPSWTGSGGSLSNTQNALSPSRTAPGDTQSDAQNPPPVTPPATPPARTISPCRKSLVLSLASSHPPQRPPSPASSAGSSTLLYSQALKMPTDSASEEGVSFDFHTQTFYDQRGQPFRDPLAQILAAYRYADQIRQSQPDNEPLFRDTSGFTAINQTGAQGGGVALSPEASPWEPHDSRVQQRALHYGASSGDAQSWQHSGIDGVARPLPSQHYPDVATNPLPPEAFTHSNNQNGRWSRPLGKPGYSDTGAKIRHSTPRTGRGDPVRDGSWGATFSPAYDYLYPKGCTRASTFRVNKHSRYTPQTNGRSQNQNNLQNRPLHNTMANNPSQPSQTPPLSRLGDLTLDEFGRNYGNRRVTAPPIPQPSSQSSQAPPLSRLGNLTLDDMRTNARVGRVQRLPVPKPTEMYLMKAAEQAKRQNKPQSLLIIIDLNGTLIDRGRRKSNDTWTERPGTRDLLSWLMDDAGAQGHGHRVMVWSSARPSNVDAMVEKLFSPRQQAKLIARWSRDELDLTPQQYQNKVQVYKRLHKVWSDPEIKNSHPAGQPWTQMNTVLIDDSSAKAKSEPYNLVEVEEFENKPWQKIDDALRRVRAYMEEVAMWSNVSNYMKDVPFKTPSG